jgi:hypothetical protein
VIPRDRRGERPDGFAGDAEQLSDLSFLGTRSLLAERLDERERHLEADTQGTAAPQLMPSLSFVLGGNSSSQQTN